MKQRHRLVAAAVALVFAALIPHTVFAQK